MLSSMSWRASCAASNPVKKNIAATHPTARIIIYAT